MFEPYQVPTAFEVEKMKLREQTFCTPDGKYSMREVRRLCDDGHQTSVVTTNKKLLVTEVASHMFARWSQENFFRYMRQDYAFDKIIEYSIDELDKDMMVVNPEYNKVDYKLKKEREKLGRRKAKFYELDQKNPLEEENQKENKKWMKEKLKVTEDMEVWYRGFDFEFDLNAPKVRYIRYEITKTWYSIGRIYCAEMTVWGDDR